MDLDFRHELCHGPHIVPVTSSYHEFEDLFEILEPGESIADQDFESVNLKATMQSKWIEHHLQVRARWWVLNNKNLPLLNEILSAIEKGKVRKGCHAKLSKKPKITVALKVRGKVIMALNSTWSVVLCWIPGQHREYLGWLLSELSKDVQTLAAGASGSSSNLKRKQRAPPGEKKQTV